MRVLSRITLVLAILISLNARAAELFLRPHSSAQGLAFARYVASLERQDPFDQSRTVVVAIEASLPQLYKGAAVAAIRLRGENGRPIYSILGVGGDDVVLADVVDRYFKLEQELDRLPASSLAITPANYKFRSAGEVKTGGTNAYIYRLTPKKRRSGMLAGQLWMDSESGAEVMLIGRLSKLDSIGGAADVVRETKLVNGLPYTRVTHVAFTIPQLGRAELVITECLLGPPEDSGERPEKKDDGRRPTNLQSPADLKAEKAEVHLSDLEQGQPPYFDIRVKPCPSVPCNGVTAVDQASGFRLLPQFSQPGFERGPVDGLIGRA